MQTRIMLPLLVAAYMHDDETLSKHYYLNTIIRLLQLSFFSNKLQKLVYS